MGHIGKYLWMGVLAGLVGACTADRTQSTIADGYVTRDDQLQQLFVEHTFYGHYPDGKRWTEYYKANGDSAYEEGASVCRGHWHVSGGTACFIYADYRHGDPNCFEIRKSGATLTFDSGGGHQSDVTADRSVAGDPQGLERKVSSSCQARE